MGVKGGMQVWLDEGQYLLPSYGVTELIGIGGDAVMR